MLIVSKGTVIHDGKTYQSGEVISDITAEQLNRLVLLGTCKHIPDQTAATASPAAGTDAGAAGDGKQTVDDALLLNVDPTKAIQTDRKK